MKSFILSFSFIIFAFCKCLAQGGYLFAHMSESNYGKLFYSISRDGKEWTTVNSGEIVLPEYLGHPNIMQGGDGVYYMIGVATSGTTRKPILYYSDDLLYWKHRDLDRAVFDVSSFGYENESIYLGAPKIFYDEDSKQYMITWHAYKKGLETGNAHWESMRTFYILTSDWQTFTEPKRLFNFSGADAEMATIDAIIVKDKNIYYCIVKDERWPETARTGKTIRISMSTKLTGPYVNPGASLTDVYHEAPTIVCKLDGSGWYLYAEANYESRYDLYELSSLSAATSTRIEINAPEKAKHGDVIVIDEDTYQHIARLECYKSGANYRLNDDGLGYRLADYYGDATTFSVPSKANNLPVVEIGEGVFQNNETLQTVAVANDVQKISSKAFCGATALKSVMLNSGSNLTSIGESAFANCVSLPKITLPAKLQTIGEEAFAGCDALTSITSKATTPPTASDNTFSQATYNGQLVIPDGTENAYAEAAGWRNFTCLSSMGIQTIQPYNSKTSQAYNLIGQRVPQSYKGIIIQNGKKMVK